MAQEGKLSRKEKKDIRIKRRALRRDLRKRGIKSREEFEIIARQLGLVYGDRKKPWILPWWLRLGNFIRGLGTAGLLKLLAVMGVAISALFLYAAMNNQKGNFTISVDGNLLTVGFDLSDTADFAHPKVRLKSDVLKEVNATSIQDLPDNLDDAEGSHNMDNVVAYTYWVRNAGEETVNFDWYLTLNAVTKGLDDAVWLMLYDEGKQTVYSTAIAGTDEAEHLSGYDNPPLYDQAADPDKQYYKNDEGAWGIRTTPYLEERIVAAGNVKDFAPNERRKYTVVIWVEGDDPDCTNDIMGAHAGFSMRYTLEGDNDGIFDDLIFADVNDADAMDKLSGAQTTTAK